MEDPRYGMGLASILAGLPTLFHTRNSTVPTHKYSVNPGQAVFLLFGSIKSGRMKAEHVNETNEWYDVEERVCKLCPEGG
jgi:hypothetical protein